MLTTSRVSCCEKWCWIIVPRIVGLGVNPKTRRQKWYSTILGFSSMVTSWNQRNRNESRSIGLIPVIKKAFSMSATNPTWLNLNLTRMSNREGVRFGPCSKQLLMEVGLFFAWIEPSKTIRSLVVDLFSSHDGCWTVRAEAVNDSRLGLNLDLWWSVTWSSGLFEHFHLIHGLLLLFWSPLLLFSDERAARRIYWRVCIVST